MSGSEGHHGPTDERLADWVDGRLAPGERAAFEAWLAEDPARQADADAYRGTVEAVRGALRQGPHARLDFASRVLDEAASTPAVVPSPTLAMISPLVPTSTRSAGPSS